MRARPRDDGRSPVPAGAGGALRAAQRRSGTGQGAALSPRAGSRRCEGASGPAAAAGRLPALSTGRGAALPRKRPGPGQPSAPQPALGARGEAAFRATFPRPFADVFPAAAFLQGCGSPEPSPRAAELGGGQELPSAPRRSQHRGEPRSRPEPRALGLGEAPPVLPLPPPLPRSRLRCLKPATISF